MLDPSRPIYTLTVREFAQLLNEHKADPPKEEKRPERRLVYGIGGLARLLGCSRVTAQKIKNSGIIDDAISQIGRKITIDADRALELLSNHKK